MGTVATHHKQKELNMTPIAPGHYAIFQDKGKGITTVKTIIGVGKGHNAMGFVLDGNGVLMDLKTFGMREKVRLVEVVSGVIPENVVDFARGVEEKTAMEKEQEP
jgi:hypothetical protein